MNVLVHHEGAKPSHPKGKLGGLDLFLKQHRVAPQDFSGFHHVDFILGAKDNAPAPSAVGRLDDEGGPDVLELRDILDVIPLLGTNNDRIGNIYSPG